MREELCVFSVSVQSLTFNMSRCFVCRACAVTTLFEKSAVICSPLPWRMVVPPDNNLREVEIGV